MKIASDEFVVTFDSAKVSTNDLISIVEKVGYTANVVTGGSQPTPKPDDAVLPNGPLPDDPLLGEILARAKREGKPIILDFHAAWCAPCKRLEKETFVDPRVVALLEQVVFVKVDSDEHPQLAKQFQVTGLPDIRFLDSEGNELRKLIGFQDAESFQMVLQKFISQTNDHQ